MGSVVPTAIPYGQPLPNGKLVLSAQDIRIMEVSNDWHEGTRIRLEVVGDGVQVILDGTSGKPQEYISQNEAKLQEQIEGLLQTQAELERKNRALEEEILDYQGEVSARQEQLSDADKKLAEARGSLAVARNFQDLIMELPVAEVQNLLDRAERRRESRFTFDRFPLNANESWRVGLASGPGPKTESVIKRATKQQDLDYFSLDGETL